MFIPDSDFFHPRSRILEPGSNSGRDPCLLFFVAHKFHKVENNFIFEQEQKKKQNTVTKHKHYSERIMHNVLKGYPEPFHASTCANGYFYVLQNARMLTGYLYLLTIMHILFHSMLFLPTVS